LKPICNGVFKIIQEYLDMKTKIMIVRILFILAVAFSIPVLLSAQTYSEKREEGKSFKLKSGTVVQITNKYGNINVMPWEKDSVRIEVSMSAQSKQAAKVVKILSSIDCEMISTANGISARTVFYDNSTTFWKDVVSYAGQVINTSNNLQINYTVFMPVNNDIKIDNKFGNIYMDSHKGNADITLSNGDLQARNFAGSLKLKLEFGSASMQDVNDAELNINYSDLTLRKVNALVLNSRSSTLEIEEAATIEIASTRDKLVVKRCNSVNGDASFARIRINELALTCNMNTKYGELRLNNVERNFRTIQVKSEYTDVFMGFSTLDSYAMDLVYDAKTNLNISSAINTQLKKETLNAKAGTIQATGNIGKSGSSHVSVTAKAGSMSLLNK
jgi:hypothetical protein